MSPMQKRWRCTCGKFARARDRVCLACIRARPLTYMRPGDALVILPARVWPFVGRAEEPGTPEYIAACTVYTLGITRAPATA